MPYRAMPRSMHDYWRELQSCPENLRGGMQRYLEHGVPPGDYLQAVLANDLMEAFSRADDISTITMPQLVRYLYNSVPMNCRGSRQAVKDWVEAGGLVGKGLLKLPEKPHQKED